MTLALFLGVLFAGILVGLPVAFALLLSAMALMLHMDLLRADIVGQTLINGVDSFPLLAVPFFLVAGEVMSRGGLSRRIVQLAMSLVGHRRGGLGYVAILTAILLAGLSGSAVADAAALVSILYPMMKQAGYPQGRSLGLLASGGIIAPIIPPSLPLILLGVAGNISIAKLFMAGIFPGLLMGLTLMVVWSLLIGGEDMQTLPKASAAERRRAIREGGWALMLPVIIIGGIRSGVFTPTEAAVVAAVYAIAISTLVYRELSLAAFYETLVAAGRTTAMVMFLVGCAMVAAWLITVAQLPQQLASLMGPLVESPRLLMLCIMILVLLVGMVMDLAPTVLILVPLLMPVVTMAGIDPVYFGLMFILNCSIGLLTPPVGTVLNVVCGVGKVQLSEAVRGTAPFLAAYVIVLGLFIAFPQIIIVPARILGG
jgi:tripartite ATP-independent transporter DctM subunit